MKTTDFQKIAKYGTNKNSEIFNFDNKANVLYILRLLYIILITQMLIKSFLIYRAHYLLILIIPKNHEICNYGITSLK